MNSEEKCKGGCGSSYIQNKKKHLCGDCVFKLTHGGKSKQEIYSERSKSRINDLSKPSYSVLGYSAEEKQEEHNRRMLDSNFGEITEDGLIDEGEAKFARFLKTSKHKPIKKISNEQAIIERLYKICITDIDYTREPVCSGCLRYQGGDIKLSHSHIISRKECKEIGKPELIYNENNIQFHCMDFGEHVGCHLKHENPKKRKDLMDYDQNMKYIRTQSIELYNKYSNHV